METIILNFSGNLELIHYNIRFLQKYYQEITYRQSPDTF